jgi:hypothetical protein
LCRLVFGPRPTDAGFTTAFAAFEQELDKHRSFCLLAEAVATTHLEFSQVRQIADFGLRNHDMLQAYVRAMAIVVPSNVVRAGVKVAFQIKAPPHPYKLFSNLDDGCAYLAHYLEMLG